GAIPPLAVALSESPRAAIFVAIAFLFVHQVEGHIVIPKLMGSALRLHPLLVIFALLAGEQLYGFGGVFITLPILPIGRGMPSSLLERCRLEPWGDAPIPVGAPVEVRATPPEPPPPPPPVDPPSPEGGGPATADS